MTFDLAGPEAPPGGRLLDIERAKGLAIILVVFGHIAGRSQPAEWYNWARTALYFFHMPFFFYLSGLVYFLTRSHVAPLGSVVRSRAERLLVPFLAMAAVIIAGKLAAQQLVAVDRPVGEIEDSIRHLFVGTDRSNVFFIWYIAALFTMSVLTVPLARLARDWRILALGAAALHFAPIPDVLYLNKAADSWVFFLIGGFVALNLETLLRATDRLWPLFLALLAVALVALVHFEAPMPLATAIAGTLSIPALHGLVRSPLMRDDRLLLWIGGYSFAIYLFNMPFVGADKAVWSRLFGFAGDAFTFGTPLLLAGGVLGPVLLRSLVLRRIPYVERLTR